MHGEIITMKAFIMAAIIGAVLIAGIMFAPLLTAQIQTASATNNCPVKDDKVICVFNIRKGDLETKSLTIGPFNINGGGGGSVGTVDQQARDSITNLTATVGILQSENAGLAATVQSQGVQLNAQAGQITTANGMIANLSQAIQELKSQVVLDVNLTNGSSVIPPVPPVINNTGNATGNNTGPVIPPVVNNTGNATGNNTGPVIPPVTNNTGNATGNVTGGGNATGTNSTANATNDTGGFVPQ